MREYKVSDRLNLGALECTGVSHYMRKAWHKENMESCYRYTFRDSNGQAFVYSGKYLGCKYGEYYNVRATIKRLEPQFNCVRLMRVKLAAVETLQAALI